MSTKSGWSRAQLLVAFYLYCRMPFGKMHRGNPEIIRLSAAIGRTPSALAMKLTNIASLDPAITGTGRKGLAGASAADRAMWEEMQANWENFAIESQATVSQLVDADVELDVENEDAAEEFVSYEGVNRVVSTMVRVGQSFFRSAVLSAYHYKCCITGIAIPKLLVASHIVPWRADTSNRLNPRNGLCLSMLHDKAFDIGIICLTDDLTVRVSKRYPSDTDPFFREALLAYDGKPINAPEKFRPNPDFLAYHRQHIFGG
ncbi:MAG: HNH endonuclease [Burkholderiaceae bacterium]